MNVSEKAPRKVCVEVCVDSIESLFIATKAGAGRIELCSSLALGGLTPSAGFMAKAAELSDVPVFAMIRPRQGDFLYSPFDKELMLEDIAQAKRAGLPGIVFGALTENGDIDMTFCHQVMEAASGMEVTFHRAIDHCREPLTAVEQLKEIGIDRILTSGAQASAIGGLGMLQKMTRLANQTLSIMPGAGVNASNAARIIDETGATEIHLSGKTIRESQMHYRNQSAFMGDSGSDDFAIPTTSHDSIAAVVKAVNTPR